MTRRRWWLLALSAALAFWSLGGEWVSIHQHVPENHFLDLLGGLAYLVAGIVALDRRPGNVIGTLMIAYGFIWYLGNWGSWQVPVLAMLGVIGSQLLGPPVLAHIALAYPSGRLQAMFDRVVLGAAYTVAIGTSAVVLLTYAPRAGGCARCAWEPAVFPSSTGAPVQAAIEASHRAAFVLVPPVPRCDMAALPARDASRAPRPGPAVGGFVRHRGDLPAGGLCLTGPERSVLLSVVGTADPPQHQRPDAFLVGAVVDPPGPQRSRRFDGGAGPAAAARGVAGIAQPNTW